MIINFSTKIFVIALLVVGCSALPGSVQAERGDANKKAILESNFNDAGNEEKDDTSNPLLEAYFKATPEEKEALKFAIIEEKNDAGLITIDY